jgi:ankyrin repeat protein
MYAIVCAIGKVVNSRRALIMKGPEQFFVAAESGDITQIGTYLGTLADINCKNIYGESALNIAVGKRYTEIVNLLLKQEKIDLHSQGYLTGTPLTFAIFSEQIEVAKQLLTKENKFINQDHPGAISWAILNNNEELLEQLKSKGANFNLSGLEGYSEPPEWILKPEPDPRASPFHREVRPYVGYTPLCLAIVNNHLDLMKYLLAKGHVDPNVPNSDGKLPLQMAVEKNQKDIVQVLLTHNANPELPEQVEGNQDLPQFLRKRSPQISSEIQRLLNEAKNKNKVSMSGEYSFFKSAPKKVIIPEMLLGPYKDVYETAHLEIKDSMLGELEKNILLDVLKEGSLPVNDTIKFAKKLFVPDSIISSIYVLYCGLHPARWDDESIPTSCQTIKKYLLDNTVKYSLSEKHSAEQADLCFTYLKNTAQQVCSSFMQSHLLLSSEEQAIKNQVLSGFQEAKSNQESPIEITHGFLNEFIGTYKDELENTSGFEEESKLEILEISRISKNSNLLSENTTTQTKDLSRFSQNWKTVYDMIKLTPISHKVRDEKKLYNIVKAILYQQEKECSWKALPAEFNTGSAYYYYKCWQRENKLESIFQFLNVSKSQTSKLQP